MGYITATTTSIGARSVTVLDCRFDTRVISAGGSTDTIYFEGATAQPGWPKNALPCDVNSTLWKIMPTRCNIGSAYDEKTPPYPPDPPTRYYRSLMGGVCVTDQAGVDLLDDGGFWYYDNHSPSNIMGTPRLLPICFNPYPYQGGYGGGYYNSGSGVYAGPYNRYMPRQAYGIRLYTEPWGWKGTGPYYPSPNSGGIPGSISLPESVIIICEGVDLWASNKMYWTDTSGQPYWNTNNPTQVWDMSWWIFATGGYGKPDNDSTPFQFRGRPWSWWKVVIPAMSWTDSGVYGSNPEIVIAQGTTKAGIRQDDGGTANWPCWAAGKISSPRQYLATYGYTPVPPAVQISVKGYDW